MADVDLREALLNNRLRHTNFFNGRLLTAEDLHDEQEAHHAHHQMLGRAVGDGVVYGLEVGFNPLSTENVVTVGAGLAINREGQVLALSQAATVRLVPAPDPTLQANGLFTVCSPQPPTATLTDTGAYLLVVGPASGFSGRAPKVGLNGNGVASGCGDRYAVEGVQFRLVRFAADDEALPQTTERILALAALAASDDEQASRLRNLLAHFCYGTEALLSFPLDPRDAYTSYGALDALRALSGVLPDCEVPLALIHWTDDGIQFVDAWSVRRRTAPPLTSTAWPLHVSPRRLAEAEAALLQFEDHLEALASGGEDAIRALDYFHYLPPAGYVPLTYESFFDGLETQRHNLDEAFVRAVLFQSFFLEAIDLADPPALRLYEVDGSPYVLFVREAETRVIDAPAETAPEVKTGRITVVVTAPERGREDNPLTGRPTAGMAAQPQAKNTAGLPAAMMQLDTSGRTKLSEKEMAEAIDRLFKVSVRHLATGVVYPAKPYLKGGITSSPFGELEPRAVESLRFRTEPTLPAGTYQVVLTSPLGEQSTQRPLAAGQHLTVTFKLTRSTPKPGTRPRVPPGSYTAEWVQPNWYDKTYLAEELIEQYADWPWVPEEKVPFKPQPEPLPPDVEEWFAGWGESIKRRFPDAPVDPGNILVYFDETYTPDDTPPQEPYAYVAFGEGGAYVPLILTPTHRSLDLPVSIVKSGIAGGDRDVERQLDRYGIYDLDVLAAGWGGLVTDALKVSGDAASNLITGARNSVEDLHEGLGLFSGVDAPTKEGLAALGIDDAISLANAKADNLAEALSEEIGKDVSKTYTQLLIDEARAAVEEEFWSLDAAEVDLSREDTALLKEQGIDTLGALREATATPEGRSQVEELLGASSDAVEGVAKNVGETLNAAGNVVKNRRTAKTPVSNMAEVDVSAARVLGAKGIATKAHLADADAADIADAFGGNAEAAAAAIKAARNQLGRE